MGQKYMDLDFGPKRKSDIEGSKLAMYRNGEIPRKGYTDPLKVDWLYIDKLCGTATEFVSAGVGSSDCIQGNLGDCWLVSALSVLATQDQLIIGGAKGLDLYPGMIVNKTIASLLS